VEALLVQASLLHLQSVVGQPWQLFTAGCKNKSAIHIRLKKEDKKIR
jgi:hypothetical protein